MLPSLVILVMATCAPFYISRLHPIGDTALCIKRKYTFFINKTLGTQKAIRIEQRT